MSAKGERQMIVPGPEGWEWWAAAEGEDWQRRSEVPVAKPGDFGAVGGGEAILLFPVRDVTAMPFKVQTADEALFEDLAALHIERLGVRVDPLGGQLTDFYEVEKEEEQTWLLAVALNPPEEGFMPVRPVGAFDFTARVLPLPGDKVAVWRELGRWVFAVGTAGKLLYCQSTSDSGPFPEAAVATEIRLALTQLALQGCVFRPDGCVVWHDEEAPESAQVFERALRLPVEMAPRPLPAWPSPPGRLLPADVRAEREARQRRQRKRAGFMVAAVAIVAACSWFGWELWSEIREARALQARAAAVAPEAAAYEMHRAKWTELAPVIESEEWPIEIIYRVVSQIPPGGNLRLNRAVIQSAEIRIEGEAPDPGPIAQFDLALRRSDLLARYEWNNTPANQNNNGRWSFTFIGTPHSATAQP